ncbi:MAG: hypothetical protein H7Y88_05910 [Phycisphaerales bacterium]|nr:hypothetical protein [Phycisphaerales bacterium]
MATHLSFRDFAPRPSRAGHHTVRMARGSVLLMVMGVLALLAIVAILYAAIGQGDRRGSATLQREVRIDEQVSAIKEYLASVIADDAVKTFTEPDPETGGVLNMREGWDYPSVNRVDTSIPAATVIDPPGDVYSLRDSMFALSHVTAPAANEFRFDPSGRGCDPWLASFEPSYYPMFDGNAATSVPAPESIFTDPLRPYLYSRGWMSISNVSPDGLFANLTHLRNNFDALPGFTPGAPVNSGNRLSDQLSVFDANGLAEFVDPDDRPLDPNLPYQFTTRQRHAFRPMPDLRTGRPNWPGAMDYYLNQWADADGDGIGDSRWWAPYRWGPGLDNLSGTTAQRADDEYIPLFPQESQVRYFIATRIIDLSAKVNAFTATDFASEPELLTTPTTRHLPAGLFPSEVDLVRLLAMSDWYGVLPTVYDGYEQPYPSGSGTVRPAGNYAIYNGEIYDEQTALIIGRNAATSIRFALSTGVLPPPLADNDYPFPAAPDSVNPLPYAPTATAPFSKYQHYLARTEAANYVGGGTPSFELARGFTLADETELLTRHGVNDPEQTSRLENIVSGASANYPAFDPLRSNRPAEVEWRGKGDSRPTPQAHAPRDGQADDGALLQHASGANPRAHLTTVSASRPLKSGPVAGIDAPISTEDLRINAIEALRKAADPAADLNDLFRGYALALAPYAYDDLAWSQSNMGDFDMRRPLFYGGNGPELALRTAAHMTVNMLDSYDENTAGTGEEPTRAMLRLVEGQAAAMVTSQAFASGGSDLDHILNLDVLFPPPNSYLAPDENDVRSAQAVEVIGTEAQPVITMAAAFHMYTDTPKDNGGDDDGDFVDLNGNLIPDAGEEDPSRQVSIDDSVDASNQDFLFHVLAFQLTNPFDRAVDLQDYYLQFGDYVFEFKPGAPNLGARDSRTYYVMSSETRADVKARWDSAFGSDPGVTVEEWIQQQLGIDPADLDSQQLNRFELEAVGATPPATPLAGFLNLFGPSSAPPAAGTLDERKSVVLLWRSMGDPLAAGARDDDILADRLRDPDTTDSTLDRSIDLPDLDANADPSDVRDTAAGIESTPAEGDNTGFSITTWGAIQRSDDPRLPTGSVPLGAIPAFCLETKATGAASLNHALEDAFDPGDLTGGDFTGGDNASATTLIAMLTGQTGSALVSELKEDAYDRAGRVIAANPEGLTYETRYPEVHLNDEKFEVDLDGVTTTPNTDIISTLRAADLLLPMGIGASYVPLPFPLASGAVYPDHANVVELDQTWTTLTEALALALDYEPEPTPLPTSVPIPLYFDASLVSTFGAPNSRLADDMFDRGNLRLDRFVPYLETDNAYGFLPDEEISYFPRVPLALTVIDQFQTLPVGGVKQGIPGLLNVSTAPLATLWTLPMLTPDRAGTAAGAGWTTVSGTNEGDSPGALYNPAAQMYDVAAALIAYRDKARVLTRLDDSGTSRPIDFRDGLATSLNQLGRADRNQVPGIREEPGFASASEILCVMMRDVPTGTNPTGFDTSTGDPAMIDLDNSIVRFGFSSGPSDPTTTVNVHGLETSLYDSPPRPDEIREDYDEQLTIAGAVLNSVTTRSDVFCVYFIVHGYTRADTEGLLNEEPMVPSIARRFVMVVDRSNVTRLGEQPKILLFKEVPM